MKKMKGLRAINWKSPNNPRDVKYGIGNVVSNIVIPMYSARWVLEISGGPLCTI